MADVLIRVVYNNTTYDLEIDNKIPLRLDISAIENTSIGKFYGVGSQTFDLPGTKNNNRFFKHAYNTGATDIPAFYNSIDGFIIYEGETILDGQFQLLEVITDEYGYTNYKCQISDKVVQFKDALESKLLVNADWSAYTHQLTQDNVVDSWNNNLLGGAIYYPLADYGSDEQSEFPFTPRVQIGDGNTTGKIDYSQTPMTLRQFLPAVNAKTLLDVIFDQVQFTYESDYINSDDFRNLYVLPKPKEELGFGTEIQNTVNVVQSIQQIIPGVSSGQTTYTTLQYNFELSDPGNNFDNTTYSYETPAVGTYRWDIQAFVSNPTKGKNSNIEVSVELYWGEFLQATSPIVIMTDAEADIMDMRLTYEFGYSGGIGPITAKLKVRHFSGDPTDSLVVQNYNNFYNVTKAPSTTDGITIDMSKQWDGQTKSIDLIKGLIEQFNLVLTPVKNKNRTIRIEPFDDWIRSGQSKDWTDIYDTAVRKSINHTIDEQRKELLFKNEDDSDRLSVLAVESLPNYQYGTQRVLADNNISQGSETIGSYFAPVILAPQVSGSGENINYVIEEGSSFIFPHLYKFENTEQKSFKFKPRLGYKVSNSLPSGKIIYIGDTANLGRAVSGSYATISNFQDLPVEEGQTLDLHFNNEYVDLIGPEFKPNDGITNFERYWQNYIDSLYWEGAHKVTLNIKFSKEDYKNIELNDQIFIKDQRYRINKISGFNVTEDDVATVELIKLYSTLYAANCAFDFDVVDTTTPTPTPSSSPTPTPTPTISPTPTQSPTPTISPTPSPSPSPTISPTPTLAPCPTFIPTPTPTATPSGQTPIPTSTPTPTPTPVPTQTPTPTAAFGYLGTSCEYPFGDNTFIVATSSVELNKTVLVDFGRDRSAYACYTLCETASIDDHCQYQIVQVFESQSCQECNSNIPIIYTTPTPTPTPTPTTVPNITGSGIVTTDLKFYWDGVPSSSFSEYPIIDNSYLWYPTVGNRNINIFQSTIESCQLSDYSVKFRGGLGDYGQCTVLRQEFTNVNSQLTMETWLRIDDITTADYNLNQLLGIVNSEEGWLYFQRQENTTNIFVNYSDRILDPEYATPSFSASLDEFYHLVATSDFNGTNRTVQFYVDAIYIGSASLATTYNWNVSSGFTPINLAQDYNTFSGGRRQQEISVGKLRFYDKILTESEIEQNYYSEQNLYK